MIKIVPTALLTVSLLCVGCQQNRHHGSDASDTPEEKVLPPLHLGAVHQVYPEQGFALLRIIGPLPGPGTILISHPADGSNTRIGNLVVTADQPSRNRIIVAQIRSGSIVKGDRVFMYRNIAQPEEKTEEETVPEETSLPQESTTPVESTPVIPTAPQTILPEEPQEPQEKPEPTKPSTPAIPEDTPEHIFDIPDNFDDWD